MAKLVEHCDGAEWGDLAFWSVVSSVTVENSVVRSGDHSYAIAVGSGGEKELGGTYAELYHRFGFYHAMAGAAGTILQYRDVGNNCITVNFDSSSGLLTASAVGIMGRRW
jgi:hypothetical protein